MDFPDQLSINIVDSGITYVDVPFDTSWRILPYSDITTVMPSDTGHAGASICEFADGSKRIFAPGTSMLIPRNVKHRFSNVNSPHTSVWIHWDVAINPGLDLFNFCDIPPIFCGSASLQIMELSCSIAKLEYHDIKDIIRMKMLSFSLLDKLLAECPLKSEYYQFRKNYFGYVSLLNFIDANLSKKLSLADIAKFQNCSISKLQRDFSRCFGISIGDFVIKRRLAKASRILCEHRMMTLSEIADAVGFCDAFSFSKAFKKHYSASPREYRNMAQKNMYK